MENAEQDKFDPAKPNVIPRVQVYLLLAILIGYPLLSIAMNLSGSTSPARISSRIDQIYLPSLLIQCMRLSIVWIVLRRSNSTFGDIGIGKEDFTASNLISGVIFFIGAGMVIIVLKTVVEKSGYFPEKDIFYLLPVTIAEKIIWIFLSLGAALAEEITFRGYALSRLKIISGNYWMGILLSSAAFSLGHLYQGLAGVVLTFVYGLLFAGLYVARRSVVPCVAAHFLQDALILLAFRGTG